MDRVDPKGLNQCRVIRARLTDSELYLFFDQLTSLTKFEQAIGGETIIRQVLLRLMNVQAYFQMSEL